MHMVEFLKHISTALLLLTGLCFFYQTVYLVVSLFWREPKHKPEKPARYAILIAARNEEAVLPYLLQSIRAQDYPSERITTYVVADNCTDRTAEAAEANGARVYRRFDRSRIGKGYALHDLLDWIRRGDGLEQYDAFLIFDADNLLCPDYISKINRTYSDGFEAFHGYRNTKNFGDSWISSAYALWYLHDSVHLNAARMMLGTTCAVTGTGFGFTRALLERIDGWIFFTLTEDVEFDNWCAVNGVRIGFCREAMLYDEQASTFAQSWKQRIRWTQGGLQVSLLYAGRQLRGMLRGGRTGWASFEAATLSLGGYLLSALSGLSVAVTGLAQSGLRGLLAAVGCAVGGLYMGMAVIGALVLLTEWRRIAAPAYKKLLSVLTFPLFMLTFIPAAVCAVFAKRGWEPTRHTVAIGIGSLAAAPRE